MTLFFLAGLVMQAVLVAVLVARRLWRVFPAFMAYSVTNLLVNGTLFFIYLAYLGNRSSTPYYFGYWAGQALCLILGLTVVFEIFTHLFAPYPALKKLAKLVFRWIVVALVVLGVTIMWAQPQSRGDFSELSRLFKSQEIFRVIEVGMITALFLFASLFGLHWRQPVFGIALGVGIYGVVETMSFVLDALFGVTTKANSAIATAVVVAFDVSLLIWIVYLSPLFAMNNEALEPASSRSAIVGGENQLEQWNQALTELIYQ